MRMHQRTVILLLIGLLMSVGQLYAEQKIIIVPDAHGVITANSSTADKGETVTLTVSPSDGYHLREGSLLVEKVSKAEDADSIQISGRRAPGIAEYVETTEVAENVFSFVMPATDVEVRATFAEDKTITVVVDTSEPGESAGSAETVTLNVVVNDDGTANVEKAEESGSATSGSVALHIPAVVHDTEGNSYPVTGVASYAFLGQTSITDIYLPDSDTPLDIAEDAFLLDDEEGENHRVPRIHTPISLLATYALMTALAENYHTQNVVATVTAARRYWTFSCGVDVLLPDGVRAYSCVRDGSETVALKEIETNKVVKANNGVLLAGEDDVSRDYEIIALPSADRPSGMIPPTDNAMSYGVDNLLEPVTQSFHFEGNSGYYVLYDNCFFRIMPEDSDMKIPACKAVLHIY